MTAFRNLKINGADLSSQRTRLANQQSRSFTRNEDVHHTGKAVGDGAGRDEGTQSATQASDGSYNQDN